MLMKHWIPLFALALTFGLLGTACSSKERQVETDNLSEVFATASAEIKAEVQTALTAIRAKDFDTALNSLRTVAQSPNLTEEQKQAVLDSTNDITVIIVENPPPNEDELYDRIEEINEALL
jgi:outer membrane protein assembly factor BamD (BamD/ComL family)